MTSTWGVSLMKLDAPRPTEFTSNKGNGVNRAYLGIFKNTIHWNFRSWIFGVRSVPSHCSNQSRENRASEVVTNLRASSEITGLTMAQSMEFSPLPPSECRLLSWKFTLSLTLFKPGLNSGFDLISYKVKLPFDQNSFSLFQYSDVAILCLELLLDI